MRPKSSLGYPQELMGEINLCETLAEFLNTLFLTYGENYSFSKTLLFISILNTYKQVEGWQVNPSY